MNKLSDILKLLNEQRGFDFSGYRRSMLERRIQKRIYATKKKNSKDYLEYLANNHNELDNLIDVFTINVSSFYRNSMTFEFISRLTFPEMISTKAKKNDNTIRIWSAGCSFGEEPYSIAISLNEYLNKEDAIFNVNIFATDIDKKALARAAKGVYSFENIKNIKLGTFNKYFTKNEVQFSLVSEIKNMVQFSFYDLLDKNNTAPPDSIFGGFDIILCRNVLIYLEPEYQKTIFNKLYKSLNKNGYLVLGEAEVPIDNFKNKFSRVNNCCKIFKKNG